jgi:hypothetical protein
VRGDFRVQIGALGKRGVSLHELRRVLRDFALADELFTQGFAVNDGHAVQF